MPAAQPARSRIIAAADQLFHERSIQGVGIDAIVERAGVAKMSLYNHFRSKDDLIAAYLRERDERVTPQIIADACALADDPAGRILAYFEVVARRIGPDYRGCPFLNALAELGALEHPARGVVEAHKERVRLFFEENLEKLGAPDPVGGSAQLLMVLNGGLVTCMLRRTNAPAIEAQRVARILVNSALVPPRPATQ